MKTPIAILLALLSFTSSTLAGDGHDHTHDAPGVKPKTFGAQIQGNETFYLEVTYQKGELRFYPFKKDQTPLELEKARFSAHVENPKVKGNSKLTLTPRSDHFFSVYDGKGTHRFTVIVTTQGTHRDQFKYTFEPRRE